MENLCVVFCVFLCVPLAFSQSDETCHTANNDIGSCISIRSCEPYMSLVRKARTDPMVANVLRSALCGFEGNNPKVCCPIQALHLVSPTTTTAGLVGGIVEGDPAPLGNSINNHGNNFNRYPNSKDQRNNDYGSNPNSSTRDIPNNPANIEKPPSTEAAVDPVKVLVNSKDKKNDPPNYFNANMTPPNTFRNEVTMLPELTPERGSFGSAGKFHETCQTANNDIGSCISIKSCEPYMSLVRKASADPMVANVLRSAQCGFEGNTVKVCCPRPSIPALNSESPTTTTADPEPAQENAAEEFLDKFPSPPVCGISTGFIGRIVGGDPAPLGAFPWMALLGYKPRRGGLGVDWKCGGSLVTERHVITAAHCIYSYELSLFLVRLGELDFASEDDGATPVDVLIKKSISHEKYNQISHENDIGLLLLNRDVEFTSLIRPICLPHESWFRLMNFNTYFPIVAGWGATGNSNPTSSHLQMIQLPVVSNEACADAYSVYDQLNIDESTICAGYTQGGKDACQGDSGGPLMQPFIQNTNEAPYYYQIGVVSYGKKCAEPGFPGVYSKITHFVPWLQKRILGRVK